MTTPYKEFMAEHQENLELYTKTIEKVHGKNHPELSGIREIYQVIHEKTQTAGEKNPDLGDDFAKLRKISSDYNIPSDGCETYKATYELLQQAEHIYKQ